MTELENLLNANGIKYEYGDYAGYKSIVIKKNKHQIEIFKDENGKYVSDLQKVPYSWGRMGSTTIEEIKNDLRVYLNLDLSKSQTSIFDFME